MRLLIVEDDPDGREILAELFRRNEWRVVAVATGEAALSELRTGGIDMVISDENLDGASGSAMLRTAALEGLLSDVVALMYTAEPESLDVPPGVRVLHKPLAVGLLVEEVKASRSGPPSSGRWEEQPTSH